MPIDGHAYLVQQGWGGKGTGLRHGAISRPVTIAQKKTLAGVGKDRDEAFPFWDHVFEAAAMSIQVKVSKDDDDSNSETNLTPAVELQRTKTGIISNRRPKTGTPALSGATTPESQMSGSGSSTPRVSVMAVAKQEAARRMLYANFFRGPVLGPSNDEATPPESPPASVVSENPEGEGTSRGAIIRGRGLGSAEEKEEPLCIERC
ncbi:hypothetical protein DAEQUDRAFT_754307 [Daedalea quercina L-15889]|uniref:G-patch domain-containing protein n=1 Tax=Daedalea quercina L-15889 TaxID=1314783 RepID=A0A165TTL9_9APHY|nr:hypothetical protein DAEQUDRAFT_754307 [Daedalea quercina L-15889]